MNKPEQYFYKSTSRIPIGGTFYTTGRYPVDPWKQWNTLSDLQDFIMYDGNDSSAYPGMIAVVVNDDEFNNGVYLIKKVGVDSIKNESFDDSSYEKIVSLTLLTKSLETKSIKLYKGDKVADSVRADGATYVLKQGDSEIASFNIEKDSFVRQGELTYLQSDGSYGSERTDEPYIHLVVNTFNMDASDFIDSDDIYIPVKGLINIGEFPSKDNGYQRVDGLALVADVQNIIEEDEKVVAETLNYLRADIDKSNLYVSNAGSDWKTSSVGGIEANKTVSDFEGMTVSEVLDNILFPTISPTKTDPSVKLKYNGSVSKLFEVGTTTPLISDFSIETDRGTLSYENMNGDYYYGGEFKTPTYTINNVSGTGGVTSVKGNYVYSVSVYCNSGATPLNNKGLKDVNVDVYIGTTLTDSMTFTALYPIYANTSSISTMTKQLLKDYYNNSQIEYYLSIPPEVINGDKFMLELPSDLKLYSVKQKNMTTNQYSIDITMESNGTIVRNGITYNKYIRTKTTTDTLGQAEYYIVIKKS